MPSIHASLNWSCTHLLERKKILLPRGEVNQKLDNHHLTHSWLHLPSAIAHSHCLHAHFHSLSRLFVSSMRQVARVLYRLLMFFLYPGVQAVYVYDNMHVLNCLSSGAVHIHPRRHTRGLSMWRNSHTGVRVQSCFLWADPHRLADQLVTSEGRVPGKHDSKSVVSVLAAVSVYSVYSTKLIQMSEATPAEESSPLFAQCFANNNSFNKQSFWASEWLCSLETVRLVTIWWSD